MRAPLSITTDCSDRSYRSYYYYYYYPYHPYYVPLLLLTTDLEELLAHLFGLSPHLLDLLLLGSETLVLARARGRGTGSVRVRLGFGEG